MITIILNYGYRKHKVDDDNTIMTVTEVLVVWHINKTKFQLEKLLLYLTFTVSNQTI